MEKYSLKNHDGQVFYDYNHQPEGATLDTYPKDEGSYLTVEEILKKYGGEQSQEMVSDLVAQLASEKNFWEEYWQKNGIQNHKTKIGAFVDFETFRSFDTAKLLHFVDKSDRNLQVLIPEGILQDLVVATYHKIVRDESGKIISQPKVTRLVSISKLKELFESLGFETSKYLDSVTKTSESHFDVVSMGVVSEKSNEENISHLR